MFRIAVLLVPLVLLELVSRGSALSLNDPCKNPDDQPGRCIFLRECPALLNIYNKQVLTPDESSFILSSRCGKSGTKSLVCCAGADVAISSSSSKFLKSPHCGLDLSDRIVGGQPTNLDEFPWTALIQYSKPDGRTGFHCGASLINSRYVLTAAHCIKAIPKGWEVLGIRLGEYDLFNDGKDCIDGVCADVPVDVAIEQIIVHEEYNLRTPGQYNDIALIRLARNVSFSTYIKPICLPVDSAERFRDIVGTVASAAGWGRTETGRGSSIKLKVSLEISDPVRCAKAYVPSHIILRDTQLCAGGLRGKDTCSGDSGGPLMKRIKSTHFLYGIVSFGPNKCGTNKVPGVYTNVVKYIEWIENNLQ
ncbi:CLIP domain-containing serine protease B4-like [Toxorhynchites rutilus septentrionalis]|uniref:CLIP domain-containing serine protease B4-like n=1 Tax=Toxorhynchites rutilus septentrionalis TaxID=329112 RepID=UPI00247AF0CF|nr:CLIP domain-containing serine protease B4-like [Toxorhynchites rutilus septentrionalis]